MFIKGKYTVAIVTIDELDQETYKQIVEFVNHEAFTNPVVVMPDTHAGKGAVIGFTMMLPDKVIPNVIGVDKGCFTGNVKVPLLNGIQYTFLELLNMGEFYVYSMDENLQLVPGKARCIKTKENSELVEVGISGGEIIKCTPDQLFMLIDGTYKKAEDLIPKQDSLMPLYRSYDTRDGYESIHSYHSRATHTHNIVAEYFLGKRPIDFFTHHKDEQWFNNSPDNLEYINKNVHSSNHAKTRNYFVTSEFKEKKENTFDRKGRRYDPKYLEKKQNLIKQNFRKYIETNRDEWLSKVKDNGKRGYKYLEPLSGIYLCEVCNKTCYNKGAFNRHLKTHKNNHKVLFVRKLDVKEDVYCLQVENHHNFAISAGVIVHNCGMLSFDVGQGTLQDLSPERIDGLIREVIPFGTDVNNEFNETGIETVVTIVNSMIGQFIDKINRCPCKECLVKGLCHDYCDRYMLLYCEGFSVNETNALYKWMKDGFHFA
jgi:tRNA-splicing ligase RtcB